MSRRFLSNVLASALSLLVSLILAEVALRVFLPPPRVFKHPQESYEFDDSIGHRLTPGQSAYTHDQPVQVNSLGVRGPEYDPRPPEGTYRVLAIGDSQTFGNGLPLAEAWPGALEGASAGGPYRLQVINGGIPATDTWQHDIVARRLAEAYHPDVLVVAVYVNDIRRPFVPQEGAVIASNSGVQRLKYLLKRSAIVATTLSAYQGFQATRAMNEAPQWEQRVVQGIAGPNIDAAWAQVETSLGHMKEWSQGMGMDFLVIALPHRAQVSGDMDGLDYNRRLAQITRRIGAPFVDMLPALTEAYDELGRELFIPWDGHNSALANEIIGEQAYAQVVEEISARGATP